MLTAVANVDGEIAGALVGVDADDQREVDCILVELDGTDTKSRLGANAILGCSLAVARAAAGGRGRAALPPARRSGGARPSGAADERDQRRRPRPESDRSAGVHARPGGSRALRRCPADRRRGLPSPEVGAPRARARDRRGRRRGIRARISSRRSRRSGRSWRPPSGPVAVSGSRSRSIRAASEVFQERRLRASRRGGKTLEAARG